MAIIDFSAKQINIKIVYYGCAMGGKTTNLLMLHKLTDPESRKGMVSIATKDDRTLFFDLLPMELGQIGGLTVSVKLYTVPGQLHYELTRRQVLAGVDGVVMVVDSAPGQRDANLWAQENLRMNLKKHGLDMTTMPIVLQWNKRDLPDARAVVDLEDDHNYAIIPSVSAVAVEGQGVVDTFEAVLNSTLVNVYRRHDVPNVSPEAISAVVSKALAEAKEAQPRTSTSKPAFDKRFDMEAYKDAEAEKGRTRQVVDAESLLAESVQTNMDLAESLEGLNQAKDLGLRRKELMHALGALSTRLPDATQPALPSDTLQVLLDGSRRSHGSLLMFQPKQDVMSERLVAPGPGDLLNGIVAEGLGSVAYRLASDERVRVIDDAINEIFFGDPPAGHETLVSVLVAPLSCDGARFGTALVYNYSDDRPFDEAEIEYWSTAARLLGLAIHWRALRAKLTGATEPQTR